MNQISFREDRVYFSTHNTGALVVFLSAEPKTHFLPLRVSVTDSFLQTGVMTLYWSCSTHSAFLFPLFINIFAETICFFSSHFSPSLSRSLHLFHWYFSYTVFFFFILSLFWSLRALAAISWSSVVLGESCPHRQTDFLKTLENKKSQSGKTHQHSQMEIRYIMYGWCA